MKRIVIGLVGVLAIGIIACTTISSTNNDDRGGVTAKSTAKWKEQALQLFSNIGYNKLTESLSSIANVNESMQRLRGKITNPFGIRDDILEFIITNVPNDNEKLVKASIMFVQKEQQIYYGDVTQQEAQILVSQSALLMTCIGTYINSLSSFNKYLSNIEKIMRDSKERDQHMWAIDRKYFSWKVIGSGLSIADEDIACEKGEF